jgi:F0F1-type ATP synthase assembly protein I
VARKPTAIALIGVGSAIVGCVVAGLVIGFFVDRSAGTTPTFTLVGIAAGIVSAVWYSYTQFRKFL